MSRAWKWILGVLAVVVVVGLVIGAVFMWQSHTAWWGQRAITLYAPGGPGSQQGPVMPYGRDGYGRYHMDDWAWRMPMHGYGMPGLAASSPFGMGCFLVAGLARLIFPLGVLALVAYLFYQMGKRVGAASAILGPAAPRRDVDALPARKVARK